MVNPFDDLQLAISTIELAPSFQRRHHLLEGNSKPGLPAQAFLGADGAMADGGDRTFGQLR